MAKLADLKKKKGSNLKKLQEKLESTNSGSAPKDERIWKPKFNKDKGKGSCVVRFLPAKDGDPFIEQLEYSFNGPGGNFWDLARQTLGEDDPVQIASISMFRKAKAEDDKDLRSKAIKYLPKRKYYANVYVVKDDEVPENEGKVFIWQFGPAIFNKIEKVIKPEFDDQEPLDPFDLWDGADFKIRMVGNEIPDQRNPGKKVLVPNYDSSEFDRPSEFMDGDEDKLEEVFTQTYDLSEFVDPTKFKSFDEVAARFKKVTGKDYRHYTADFLDEHLNEKAQQEKLDQEQDNDDGSNKHREDEKGNDSNPTSDPDEKSEEGEDDDVLARFRKLANQS